MYGGNRIPNAFPPPMQQGYPRSFPPPMQQGYPPSFPPPMQQGYPPAFPPVVQQGYPPPPPPPAQHVYPPPQVGTIIPPPSLSAATDPKTGCLAWVKGHGLAVFLIAFISVVCIALLMTDSDPLNGKWVTENEPSKAPRLVISGTIATMYVIENNVPQLIEKLGSIDRVKFIITANNSTYPYKYDPLTKSIEIFYPSGGSFSLVKL